MTQENNLGNTPQSPVWGLNALDPKDKASRFTTDEGLVPSKMDGKDEHEHSPRSGESKEAGALVVKGVTIPRN